jgi:hypothetical protein
MIVAAIKTMAHLQGMQLLQANSGHPISDVN